MESSAAIEITKQNLLSFGIMPAVGSFCGFLAQKVKVPDIVMFLLAGIVLVPELFGVIDMGADSSLNQIILIFGSGYILFSGGASLRFKVLKEAWITIVVIAAIGVLITAGITTATAFFVFKVLFILSLLLGASFASPDPATLVPILKQDRTKDRVSQAVISESAFNDAMGTSEFSMQKSLTDLARQSVLGIFAGGIIRSLLGTENSG